MPVDPNDPSPDELPAFKFPVTTNYGREMRRWDKKKRDGGMNADGFEKFPMMLHRAKQLDSGKWVTSKPEPDFDATYRNESAWDRDCRLVAKFNSDCQRVVQNEQEYELVKGNGEGWCDTPSDALAWREKLEKEIGRAALERELADRKMSAAAQKEAKEADEATADHLPEIPRRGRKHAAA